MKFSNEKEQQFIKEYLAGANTVEIAKKYDTYNTSVRRVLIRNGVTLRGNKEAHTVIKENPFKDNDEFSEYFLGLLLTDGCVQHRKESNSVSTTLSLKDYALVEQFKNFINPRATVSKVLQKKFNTYMYTASFRNDSIANWLESRGNFKNKSYKCDIYVPLTWHILRGIFDGDGYWHSSNKGHTMSWGVCGKSKIFLIKIKNFLESCNIKSYLTHKCKGRQHDLYYLEVFKVCDTVRIAYLMYNDAHIYLKRKYETRHLFEETLREKFSKFKESVASANPEPSHNSVNHLINMRNGRYIMEGAETIMRYLNL